MYISYVMQKSSWLYALIAMVSTIQSQLRLLFFSPFVLVRFSMIEDIAKNDLTKLECLTDGYTNRLSNETLVL